MGFSYKTEETLPVNSMGQVEQQTCVASEEGGLVTASDCHSFKAGTHSRLYEKLGAHPGILDGTSGCHFAVWAPNAQQVSVLGDFNNWEETAHPLSLLGDSGIWTGFVPDLNPGALYQYQVVSWHQGRETLKADPFGFKQAESLSSGSYVWDLSYRWADQDWMSGRAARNGPTAPLAIYQVHLGSWMRVPEENNRMLTFRELAPKLAEYASTLGFTHVELLPVMTHLQGRGGENLTESFYSPDARCGAPQDLMFLIDHLHQRGLGVILDWCPSYFSPVEGGLAYFDGTPLYEQGAWRLQTRSGNTASSIDYSRPEVRSFLLSSAFFWCEKYHADMLRLGAAAAMLYLDFGRGPGEWVPNPHGGRENPDGLGFIRQLNSELDREYPDVRRCVEEGSAWPMATQEPKAGGLGFNFKWDTSFVEGLLQYMSHDPFFRKFHHRRLAARSDYAYSEAFVLPLGGPESCSGGASLLARMPGDEWQRFANLRLLLGFLYLQPGKKLLFMGSEFAQWQSWKPDRSLDWHLCGYPFHHRMQRWVGDLNHLYRSEAALFLSDTSAEGFEWVERNDAEQSTASWLRRDPERREALLAVCNFTPVVRRNYRVGVRRAGYWLEVLNSDAKEYGGSGQGNFGGVSSSPFSAQGFPHLLSITVPPLGVVVFKHQGGNL